MATPPYTRICAPCVPSPGQHMRSPLCLLASGGSAPAAAWTLAPSSGLVSRRGRGRWGQGAWGHWGCYYSGLRHTPGTCRRPASVSLTPSARVLTRVPFLSCVCLSLVCRVRVGYASPSISQAWDPSSRNRDSLFSVPFSAEPLASASLPDPGQNLSCSVALARSFRSPVGSAWSCSG